MGLQESVLPVEQIYSTATLQFFWHVIQIENCKPSTIFCLSKSYRGDLSGNYMIICSAGKEMKTIEENYQRIVDDRRSFDIRFWQSQGDRAIFEAVWEMLHDYFLIRGKDAYESRLQRTVESFRKA